MSWKRVVAATVAGIALGATAASAAQIVAIETIALSGEAAPGTEGTFAELTSAVINPAGEVAFQGRVGSEHGNWWWSGGAAELVVIAGMPAPGFEAFPIDFVGGPEITSEGFATALGFDTGASDDDSALYAPSAGGALVPIAREGEEIGGTGFQLAGADKLAASEFGVATRASVAPVGGGVNREALLGPDGSGGLRILMRATTSLPGVSSSSWTRVAGPLVNDAGTVISYGAVSTPSADRDVLVAWDAGQGPTILVREPDPAPGTDATILRFTQDERDAGLNASGEYAFFADLTGGTLPETDLSAVYGPDGAGGIRLLAGGGLDMPGTAGARAGDASELLLTDDGTTVAILPLHEGIGDTVADVNDEGIWATAGHGPLHLVMRTGAEPPGVPGTTWSDAITIVANGNGEVVFLARHRTSPSDTNPDWGLWHHSVYTQQTSLLLKEGDAIEVAPGDSRTLRSFTSTGIGPIDIGDATSGGSDGKGRVWNDAGELAAILYFSDLSEGVFRITVPEPGMGAALLAALATLAVRRRVR